MVRSLIGSAYACERLPSWPDRKQEFSMLIESLIFVSTCYKYVSIHFLIGSNDLNPTI